MDWNNQDAAQKAEEKRRASLIEHEARIGNALKTLSQTKDGRYFLRWLCQQAGVFQQEFPQDERAGMWSAGRRSLGMQIFAQCAAHNIADMLVKKEISDV